jgi:hypothetical protein
MASQYDDFWKARLEFVRELIKAAAEGKPAELDVSDIRELGKRMSWSGSARVRGKNLIDAPMAHARSLGRLVAEQGLCNGHPDQSFKFAVTASCSLRVRAERMGEQLVDAPREFHDKESNPAPLYTTTVIHEKPNDACGHVHELLSRLPFFEAPSALNFTRGLYFFYEKGENTAHVRDGRVVRVGNHPRSEDGLVPRLRNHYSSSVGAKNGSVFRRYLGGALIRRSDPNSPCLASAPGLGHWEKQNAPACNQCTPIEKEVTQYIGQAMKFRCVQISDKLERNVFEKLLVATIAQCSVCQPSSGWLGKFSYSSNVPTTGLWNSDYVDGPPISEPDLRRFSELVMSTPDFAKGLDLSDTLLIIPCCGEKLGNIDPGLPERKVVDNLSPTSAALLENGRRLALAKPKVSLEQNTPMRSALAWYTGQPYATEGFRDLLIEELRNGLHCLIISGGYGLLRPEEPIHRYKAHLSTTFSIWKDRLPTILRDYVARNGIRRTFGSFSTVYSQVVPGDLAEENWRAVPEFDPRRNPGIPLRVVPKKIGAALVSLMHNDFLPGEDWIRVSSSSLKMETPAALLHRSKSGNRPNEVERKRAVNSPKPSIDEVWSRIRKVAGEAFETKTGEPFTYEISGDVFHPSRTKYNIPKTEFGKALAWVPFNGPGVINRTVRGPAYVWAVLHDKRIRQNDR